MGLLLKEIRRNPILWLLAFVPTVFIVEHLRPEAGTLLFVLSILAVVPLAALLSQATESVASRTGASVGGLLKGMGDVATKMDYRGMLRSYRIL